MANAINTDTNIIQNTNEEKTKIKIGFLSKISSEWVNLHSNIIQCVADINTADYIIFESNGDPINVIMNIKLHYPKNKLVFILSGDQSIHIDNECIWFTNAIKASGLADKQTQIFVTNPAIYKFYNLFCNGNGNGNGNSNANSITIDKRPCDIYFKGTIWLGMRTEMYNYFKNKNNCIIVENNNYWSWRINGAYSPSQTDIENTAYETYRQMLKCKLVLCPKGNGNSSMRIIEALACGAIPVLIDDFSNPFNIGWHNVSLVFNTKIDTWDTIYDKCQNVINSPEKLHQLQQKGKEFFENYIYCDAKYYNRNGTNGNYNYKDINTVAYGFSTLIINKLVEMHNGK